MCNCMIKISLARIDYAEYTEVHGIYMATYQNGPHPDASAPPR